MYETENKHPIKFIYSAELYGVKSIIKLLGVDFFNFTRMTIISNEFDSEHEATINFNCLIKEHLMNLKINKVDHQEMKNPLFYSEGSLKEEWDELVAKRITINPQESEEGKEIDPLAIIQLHIIPQLASFEPSKLKGTAIH